MVDYEKDVEEEADEFILDHEDNIKEAITDNTEDFSEVETKYGEIRDSFHEVVIDRAYSPSDAVCVLENCENEETDSGLWEGQDWRDELSSRAAYSFGNDVWFKCEEIYNELKERVETMLDENAELERAVAIEKVFVQHKQEGETEPVEKGSEEEKELLRRWLNLNKDAGLWGGYPVGSSYIDARCGTGYGMPDVKDFVDFDHEMVYKLPWMRGKYKDGVEIRLKELKDSF